MVGKIQYSAPEVASSAYNERCDIWSIGVIACQLLSGSLPFGLDQMKNEEFSKRSVEHAKKWLQQILINSESYELLDWSQVIRLNYPPYKYILSHKFIHQNEDGIKERCAITIYLDGSGKVINFHKWKQQNI